MTEQEQKIIRLLLNEMAFEGAERHFKETPPDIPESLVAEIEGIEIPMRYDGNSESYRYAEIHYEEGATAYSKCHKHFRVIRHNIIHANKAFRPDTPKRLQELLDWSERFIAAVYETNSDFAFRASEIKSILKIESF